MQLWWAWKISFSKKILNFWTIVQIIMHCIALVTIQMLLVHRLCVAKGIPVYESGSAQESKHDPFSPVVALSQIVTVARLGDRAVMCDSISPDRWTLKTVYFVGQLKEISVISILSARYIRVTACHKTQPFQALQVNMGIFPFSWRALQLTSIAVFVDTLTLLPLSIQAICPVKYHVVQYDIGSISATRLAFIFMVAPIWRATAI